MNMPGKRLGWIGLAVVAAATQLTTATAAHADDAAPGKSLVLLGDSFTANPPYTTADLATLLGGKPDVCIHNPNSWANQLVTVTGTAPGDFDDQSCAAATLNTGEVYTLAVQAKAAAQAGDFGPDTKLVTLQFGINDSWTDSERSPYKELVDCVTFSGVNCINDNQSWETDDHGITSAAYADRIRNVVTYVRYYAPHARIEIVGYPEEFTPGQTTMCVNVGTIAFPEQNTALAGFLDHIQTAEQDAAQQLGIDFLDVRSLTAGHGLCSDDPWVNKMNPPNSGLSYVLHPTAAGDAAVAQALAAQIGN